MAPRPVSKPDVVVVALAELGGATRTVDTEDVAFRAHELAPTSFTWRKYPGQVNLDGVRVALTDAAKQKRGGLVEGSVRAGWSLTPSGVAWMQRHGEGVRARLVAAPPPSRDDQRSETRKRGVERTRVRNLAAWKLWSDGASVSICDAEEIFRIDRYTQPRMRRLQVNRLLELLEADELLGPFLNEMARLVLDIEGVDDE